PITNVKVRSGIVPFLIGGFAVAAIFFSAWLPSTELIVTRSTSGNVASDTSSERKDKPSAPPSSRHTSAPPSTMVTVDESGESADFVTRIWKDVRDGKNYRTRAGHDALILESVNGSESANGLTHCEFRRATTAGLDWAGFCTEQNRTDQSSRYV